MAKILLMDDEDALRAIMVEVLTEEGHEVIESADGRIALDEEVVASVDLMITDIIMPDVEGVEAIRSVVRIRPDLPIIAISGGGRTVTVDFLPVARGLGAMDTLKKPFTPDELVERVEALLSGRAAAA
jgi:DNA-binding response OmpR family regulator